MALWLQDGLVWRVLRFKGLEGLERLERFRAGKRQTWAPIRTFWCVALGCLLAARVAIRSHWCVARGGCWLQGEVWTVLGLGNGRSYWCGLMAARWVGLEVLSVWSVCSVLGLANGRSYWCGFMAARWVGLEGFKGFKGLEGLERLERFRAGKRQTWAPIRSFWCVALGCLLAARVAIRSHWCVARGGCWLQGEVWTVLGLGNGRSYWCGLMAARWVSLEGFKRLERFRAGKRQKLLMWLYGCKMGWFGGF